MCAVHQPAADMYQTTDVYASTLAGGARRISQQRIFMVGGGEKQKRVRRQLALTRGPRLAVDAELVPVEVGDCVPPAQQHREPLRRQVAKIDP